MRYQSIEKFKKLKELQITSCKRIQEINLDDFPNLHTLGINNYDMDLTINNSSNHNLTNLILRNVNIKKLNLNKLRNLKSLTFDGDYKFFGLCNDDFKYLKSLKFLKVSFDDDLDEGVYKYIGHVSHIIIPMGSISQENFKWLNGVKLLEFN